MKALFKGQNALLGAFTYPGENEFARQERVKNVRDGFECAHSPEWLDVQERNRNPRKLSPLYNLRVFIPL